MSWIEEAYDFQNAILLNLSMIHFDDLLLATAQKLFITLFTEYLLPGFILIIRPALFLFDLYHW